MNIVMIGATGAVGTEVVRACLSRTPVEQLTLLGRSELNIKALGTSGTGTQRVIQHKVDVIDAASYEHLLGHHTVAICTLGVGEPSRISKDDFIKIDKTMVLAFAAACRQAGVKHFQLLGSVGADSASKIFYLRVKGELQDGLRALNFDRLSLFQPSMILTPTNRYGWSQALTLRLWPWISLLLIGRLRKYRGIKVDQLGKAIANNATTPSGSKEEILQWDKFVSLAVN